MSASFVRPVQLQKWPASPSQLSRRWARLRSDQIGFGAVLVCLVIVVLALIGPALLRTDPLEVDLERALLPPSRLHLFGTDELGRDVFSRVLHGARLSIALAVAVVALAVVLGTTLGTVAGYFGGLADHAIMRVTDIFLAFPALILAIALAAALGPSPANAALALGLVWWPSYARLVRGQVLGTRVQLYVEAARSFGARDLRILWRHILPNCFSPVAVRITLTGANAILMISGLGFIGIGARPPAPEWGLMIAFARRYIFTAWWYPALVSMALFITVLMFTMASDAIQDALESKLVGEG